uniref:Uncharacterized protein n=1 Tax=Timema cristinae TaxID=61476 RepID=A0A7R9GT54_TIMCR|nr:unnamed protein product [Timema cristinae]
MVQLGRVATLRLASDRGTTVLNTFYCCLVLSNGRKGSFPLVVNKRTQSEVVTRTWTVERARQKRGWVAEPVQVRRNDTRADQTVMHNIASMFLNYSMFSGCSSVVLVCITFVHVDQRWPSWYDVCADTPLCSISPLRAEELYHHLGNCPGCHISTQCRAHHDIDSSDESDNSMGGLISNSDDSNSIDFNEELSLPIPGTLQISFELAEGPHYMLFLCQAWTIIRCLNFSLDRIAAPDSIPNLSELITMLAYCLYFPTLILGPLLSYQNFKADSSLGLCLVSDRFMASTMSDCAFKLVSLHCHLASTVTGSVVTASGLTIVPLTWSLRWVHGRCNGLGYCMGQFFMLKYVVMYGLMGTIAQAENINAPRHPKCIARISLYSDMWRYFDEGLYRFLLRILARKLYTIPVIILLLPAQGEISRNLSLMGQSSLSTRLTKIGRTKNRASDTRRENNRPRGFQAVI